MPDLLNRTYYQKRAARLLDLASLATDPEIEAIHRKMARSYVELAELAGDHQLQSEPDVLDEV